MTALSVTVRAAHLLTNAAWFGGSLMGAAGLNPAAREAGSREDQMDVSGTGWERWGPVQGAAIGAHLLSGLAIIADNKRRVAVHPPTTTAVVLKTALTGAALAASAAAYQQGERLGDSRPGSPEHRRLSERMRWLQWGTPVTTGALLVLDAYLGEQQRGPAGLLDRALGR